MTGIPGKPGIFTNFGSQREGKEKGRSSEKDIDLAVTRRSHHPSLFLVWGASYCESDLITGEKQV